jgi:hypothetical protein
MILRAAACLAGLRSQTDCGADDLNIFWFGARPRAGPNHLQLTLPRLGGIGTPKHNFSFTDMFGTDFEESARYRKHHRAKHKTTPTKEDQAAEECDEDGY